MFDIKKSIAKSNHQESEQRKKDKDPFYKTKSLDESGLGVLTQDHWGKPDKDLLKRLNFTRTTP